MSKIKVYDPVMSCSNGLCGPDEEPVSVQFSNALEIAEQSGATVERFSLGTDPAEFVTNPEIRRILESEGISALPLVYVDGMLVSKGSYPNSSELLSRLAKDAPQMSAASARCRGFSGPAKI